MKLSQLYTSHPHIFETINFNDGLNCIVAEIRLPGNSDEDTHNLGKSTLRDIINFCLISKKEKDFFLFHNEQFSDFIFYLEIQLCDKSYLTLRRAISTGSKISFKAHREKNQNFNSINKDAWDHFEVGYEKAKQLLDSYLNLTAIKPYSFRKIIGYLLRAQTHYGDPFDLGFKGAHVEWKPVLSKILGLNSDHIENAYTIEQDINQLETKKSELAHIETSSISEIEGIIALKSQFLEEKEAQLNSLDFSSIDQATSDALVKELGAKIKKLNNDIYYIKANLQQVEDSLSASKVKFDIQETQQLFNEIGIIFNNQVIKDYSQLIEFQNDIMKERRSYLLQEKKNLSQALEESSYNLKKFNQERSEALELLKSDDILNKYKKLANEVASIKMDIVQLQEKSKEFHELKEIQLALRKKKSEHEKLVFAIENDIELATLSNSQCKFAEIRLKFSNIINSVISEPAMLAVKLNSEKHLTFSANLLDSTGNKTSADKGNSYKKLLCIAFDLAILCAYSKDNFPHFVFHDGVFETLDDRKKENLLTEMRNISKDYGIQQIVTMIDSDSPNEYGQVRNWLDPKELTLILHDDGEKGRLFKMPSW